MTATGFIPSSLDRIFARPTAAFLVDGDACDRCGFLACRKAMSVVWPTGDARGTEWLDVGRGCVADTVVLAREYARPDGAVIEVQAPAWDSRMATGAARLDGPGQLVKWTLTGYLRAESDQGRFVWLADEVMLARQMGVLVKAGVRSEEAASLARYRPEDVPGVLAALLGGRKAARAAQRRRQAVEV